MRTPPPRCAPPPSCWTGCSVWHDEAMKLSRRQVLAALAAATSPSLFAQAKWPGKPIRIIVPFGTGGDAVAHADPDGTTLLLMSNGTAVSAGLFNKLPFDAQKDFAPISLLGTFDIAVFVPKNSRFKTLGDLLADAKARPGKLNIATIAVGSTQNLAAELFKTTAGIDAQVVPFNGTPAVITALRGGTVDAGVEILSPVMPQITGKALRVLAVM